jgi:hypothetical protein
MTGPTPPWYERARALPSAKVARGPVVEQRFYVVRFEPRDTEGWDEGPTTTDPLALFRRSLSSIDAWVREGGESEGEKGGQYKTVARGVRI